MRATEIDKEIMVLTHAKLKALELIIPKKKEKIEPIDTAGKSGLLFYPTIINVSVLLGVDGRGHATALVPMAVDSSVYQFNLIDASKIDLLTFLRESIIDFRSVKPRTFNINELRCANYKDSGLPENNPLILYNVTIKSTVTPIQYGETITWNIEFMLIDSDKQEVVYRGMMEDTYKDPKRGTGRTVSNPTWQKVSNAPTEVESLA